VTRRALDEIAAPLVEDFDPTWVLVSAGFDAHHLDPMADLCLNDSDFAAMATCVSRYVTTPGRVAFFLEGGYHLDALRASVTAALTGALGDSYRGQRPTSGGPGGDQIARVKAQRLAALQSWARVVESEATP
jgi:acetoin utilization deacetylase AcuC-like enzyme